MKKYIVNKNTNTNPGNHNEVHNEDCKYYDQITNYDYLGEFSTCHGAVAKAKVKGYDADGCADCCPDCNND